MYMGMDVRHYKLACDLRGISNQSSRNTTHNVESLCRTIGGEPVVDEIRETIEEEVLEDHGHDENLVCVVTEGIQSVRRRGNGSDGDAEQGQAPNKANEVDRNSVHDRITE